jgi:hypothetical protein
MSSPLLRPESRPRPSLDRIAIGLSGLCAAHCVATVVLVGALPLVGHMFQANWIHETGLAIAIVIGAVALFAGVQRHGSLLPTLLGTVGIGLMTAGLMVDHGKGEAILTVLGVSILATGHLLNQRSCRVAARRGS